ncbi:endonuclease/exonuclease/phosphatase [Natrialba magadii ATCC 43099]|uniref:Endonuclease/exonuclease/phosphatase n=1 Tax=Natrialba magadii (strain ATCC 43099 / DSM 3394 / CCM 3739 / CIP 104546 / IAM 13178 / JCM 8861 / NBRC 102185 / NCIMB 2190 / MS3) TaxID=547559 RepID=D3SQV6_NATMM|nr:endonuclease/exonuclease/phosphatase family protein [Natrialba magadii]ADD04594.1 endonuclease/exonuclease/phosphatase [Natrialba magadii ATCC 43099]ELY25250.1 endonuclease/exonuclease/phosphatase [Natrialba magadii ATCC 43099]
MKILSCNAGYLLGYENVLGGYVPPPIGATLGDTITERQAFRRLVSLIERERPDVVSLLEVDRGSHRTITDGQFQTLRDSLQRRGLAYDGDVANKYGDSGLVQSLPFFGQLGNAVLSRANRNRTIVPHYLSAGRKRLVLEVELAADVVLFMVHLSLGTRSRGRQLAELATLIRDRAGGREVVVTGDFNTFAATDELHEFTDQAALELQVPGETVPARPFDDWLVGSRSLDLFCCSPSLDVGRCDVLDVQLSDHRPIVLELDR